MWFAVGNDRNGMEIAAIIADPQARDHGWLYVKGADGQWVTHRRLEAIEIEEAYDQAADMAVLQGTKVRAG